MTPRPPHVPPPEDDGPRPAGSARPSAPAAADGGTSGASGTSTTRGPAGSGALAPTRRLASVDALRGLDMLMIVGLGALLTVAAENTGWPALRSVAHQLEHADWHGFTLWDLIFPLFLFLSGVTLPLWVARRRARGLSDGRIAGLALRRGLLLVALGVVYNGLLSLEWQDLRVASVLGRIGLAWTGAAWVVLAHGTRGRVVWVAVVLLGYWALLSWVPVPGHGPPSLDPGRNLTDWFDQRFLPGRLHRGVRDPEGLLGIVPAVGTALLGALAGQALTRPGGPSARRAGELLAAGVLALGVAYLWQLVLPLNKNLWTSSFALWCAGASACLLAVFHLVVDVGGRERLALPLVVVGANPITIYLLSALVDFGAAASWLFRPTRVHPVAGALCLQWLLLLFLYRRRIFLRV